MNFFNLKSVDSAKTDQTLWVHMNGQITVFSFDETYEATPCNALHNALKTKITNGPTRYLDLLALANLITEQSHETSEDISLGSSIGKKVYAHTWKFDVVGFGEKGTICRELGVPVSYEFARCPVSIIKYEQSSALSVHRVYIEVAFKNGSVKTTDAKDLFTGKDAKQTILIKPLPFVKTIVGKINLAGDPLDTILLKQAGPSTSKKK